MKLHYKPKAGANEAILHHLKQSYMKKVTRTDKEPHPEWLFGLNPNAIENQEAQGQQELVNGSQLPRYINDYGRRQTEAIKDYLLMGIEVWAKFNGKMSRIIKNSQANIDKDELFITAKLPEGWQLKATDHSMWSELLDNNGAKRGSIFYKAAFYDRDAFINLQCRYGTDTEYIKDYPDQLRILKAIDHKNKTTLWESPAHGYDDSEKYYKEVRQFLETTYPGYSDPHAFWGDN